MTDKPTNHDDAPELSMPRYVADTSPDGATMKMDAPVNKTIVLPTAQVPAEPPQAAQPLPKPAGSDTKEK